MGGLLVGSLFNHVGFFAAGYLLVRVGGGIRYLLAWRINLLCRGA